MSYDPDLTRRVLFGTAEVLDLRPLFRGLLRDETEEPAMTYADWTHRLADCPPDALPLWEPSLLEPSVPFGDEEQEADARDWLGREFEPVAVEDAEGRLVLLVRERHRPIYTLPYLFPAFWPRLSAFWADWRDEVLTAAIALGIGAAVLAWKAGVWGARPW